MSKAQKTKRIAFRTTPATARRIKAMAKHFNLSLTEFLTQSTSIATAHVTESHRWYETLSAAHEVIRITKPWNTSSTNAST
jgi:hypothetical protein